MAQSFACGETLARRGGVSTRHRTRRSVGGRDNQTAASTATHLTPFASRVAGLVGGPLVGGAFLVSRASALAGDLTLLLGGHRRESSPFLAFSCIHYWASVFLCARHRAIPNYVWTLLVRLGRWILDARGTRLVGWRLRGFIGI